MTVKSAGRSPGAISMPQPRPTGRGVNSAWVRRVNAVLLMQALRRHPGSSQRELAVLTGLDKATVSAVTSQLVDAGLVARSNAAAGVRRLGRPAVALSIPRSAGIVFGVRLEPDRIAVVAADLGGRIIDREVAAGLGRSARGDAIALRRDRKARPAPRRGSAARDRYRRSRPDRQKRATDLRAEPRIGATCRSPSSPPRFFRRPS